MDAGPWANYAYAVKLQQQQNQFNNNPNNVNNLNRNNGSSAAIQQQQGCYNLNNFNQNQMYTQNMESLLAHYSHNEAGFHSGTFNSHHNTYDAEFFSNQFQNAAKASLSAAGLFKSSSKTKDNQHCAAALSNNQLNANNLNNFNNLNHDAGANFLSQHLPNWRHTNLNINHDVNNQPTKPFGVLPHQTANSNDGSVQLHSNKHHHNQYALNHNSNELNGHHSSTLTKSCSEQPNRHNQQLNKRDHSNASNLLPAMMHHNFMQNSVNNQLNNSTMDKHYNNFMENQAIFNNSKSNLNKNQLPQNSTQTRDQYLIAMNNQQMLMKATFNHHAQQLANQQRTTSNNHNNANTNTNNNASSVINSNSSSSTVNPHMNFQKNLIHSQNVNSSCLINNNNLMNKTFNNAMVNNTYCSMMMGGIQINNYNVSNHNNLIIANQAPSNCSSSVNNANSSTNQQTVNNFIMNNMNNLNNLSNSNNGINLLNGSTTMMNNNNSTNLNNSRCSSVASVSNVQQINESSSCSYGNFSSNSPHSFNNNSNNTTNSPTNNRNLSSSQQQLNNVPNEFTNSTNNYNLVTTNNSSSSFPHSNTPALSSTPGYPTPPSSVNRSEIMSQQSVQSSSQDEQLMQTHFNQNHFNGCNNLVVTSYNKLTQPNGNGYLNSNNQLNNLPDSNNSTNCLPNLMNITPVSDTMSDNSKLNDSQCSAIAINLNNINVHNQQIENNSLQFNDELGINSDQQINFHNNQNSNQLIVQTKKKKDKTKKKKKKSANTLSSCNLINNNSYYQNAQSQYPIYQQNGCNGYFLNNMQSNQLANIQPQDQMNLQSTDEHLIQHHHSNGHLNQLNSQCMFENQNCQVNDQSLNGSNCSNEQLNLMNSNHDETGHLITANVLEDKLACLEDDLNYLTQSNECMLDEDKDLSDEKAYTSDNNSNNNSCSLDDDSMMRHHHHQITNDQTSLNGSINGGALISQPVNSMNESPIDDLSKHYEFEESNLEEAYAKNEYELNQESLCLNEDKNSILQLEDKKSKKKSKKKEKCKVKETVDKNVMNGLIKVENIIIETKTTDSSLSPKTMLSASSILDSSKLMSEQTLLSTNSLLIKKCKIERDEYEFTDEFAPTSDACSAETQPTSKKRKKINCENVNKKNKLSMNSLNEELIKSFNSAKEKKEEKQSKIKLKVLTSSKDTNSEHKKNSVNSVNNIETSSTTSSSSSTSFSLNSKKENQDLVCSSKNRSNVQQNGQLNNGAINSKSIVLNANNKNLNQNAVQINNKKIITGKNINNQIESKKNEVSILSKNESTIKNDKKELSNGTLTINTSSKSSNGTITSSTKSTTTKRRSSEKKALTIREGLMRTSDFVISKEAIEKNLSLLWRIEGKSLLQLFTPVEENGSLFYQNTSSYSAWNPSIKERYVGVDVRIMGCNRNKITVEKLSINKSNGNGNIEEKLLSDAKDDLSHSLFSPSQHSTNFAVYIQTLISQILDPHFISEIIEENDEYFINHIQKIDECCLSKKAKIYSKIKWETGIIKCIETYPKCEAILQENSGDLRCKFCYEKWSTQILNFTGEMYDPITLEHLRNDELKLNKYAACEPCKNKVMTLSNLLHQKYHFYIKCGEKVEEMREGDDSKKYHIILEQCLQDADWIESLFKELKHIWTESDKV